VAGTVRLYFSPDVACPLCSVSCVACRTCPPCTACASPCRVSACVRRGAAAYGSSVTATVYLVPGNKSCSTFAADPAWGKAGSYILMVERGFCHFVQVRRACSGHVASASRPLSARAAPRYTPVCMGRSCWCWCCVLAAHVVAAHVLLSRCNSARNAVA
jgi:hypothetical protein